MQNLYEIPVEHILYALEHDEEFFIQFFLGDELIHPVTREPSPVPSFHKDVFHLMVTIQNVTKAAFALPRDHAKTTLAKLAVVWFYLFSYYSFVVYVSNTASVAVAAVNDIVSFLESENFENVFGEVEWIIKQDGVGYYKFILHLPGNSKTCILKALGSGQQVRGLNINNRRPQLAIVDDLEDNDNTATEELQFKLKKWFYGPFLKALDKFSNKVIMLGNMISNTCMLKENCESEYWFSRRYGALLSDGTPLWPEAWSVERLREDFNMYLKMGMIDIWFAEMMNMPIMAGKGLIKANEIYYLPEVTPADIEYGFITLDLAITDKTWAHKTVATVHGWNGDCWQVCEQVGDTGLDPIDLFDIVVELMFKWNISIVGIEAVAYQKALKPVFEYLCRMRHIEGVEFFDLSAVNQKVQRLAAWASLIKRKEYALTEGDYVCTEQLLFYDPKKRENDDDFIDSAAHGVEMIDNHIIQIVNSRAPEGEQIKSSVMGEYEVCEV